MSSEQADKIDQQRRRFLLAATSLVGGVGVIAAATPFVSYLSPGEAVQAAGGPVEIDLSKLGYGEKIVVEWRGKPIWIVRRTKAMLDALPGLGDQLRDPDSIVDQQPTYARNIYRSIVPEYLVLVGLCTHLGCVPTFRPEVGSVVPDWLGGFYCPCHGSKFDLAGRVYRNVPAPVNLEVPPYKYLNDHVILIGKDEQ